MSRIDLVTFGKQLRAWRLTLGLRQDELGDRAGLAVTQVAAYEMGYLTPPWEHVLELERALGLAAGELSRGQRRAA